jgi:hypothetical protein
MERANSNNFNAKDRPNALKIQEEDVISFFISFEERSYRRDLLAV